MKRETPGIRRSLTSVHDESTLTAAGRVFIRCRRRGVTTWRDAVEFLALGAGNVQVCTAAMHKGFKIVEDAAQQVDPAPPGPVDHAIVGIKVFARLALMVSRRMRSADASNSAVTSGSAVERSTFSATSFERLCSIA